MTPTIILALLFCSGGVLWLAQRARQRSGLPWGTTIATDMGGALPDIPTLVDDVHGLVGKPDYILKRREGLIPVEVKPTRKAKQPFDSDIYQLAAYCLLVEQVYQRRPPYGLLRYAQHTFRIEYDDELRADIIAIIAEMRTRSVEVDCDRDHHHVQRCRGCGFWDTCEQSLFDAEEYTS